MPSTEFDTLAETRELRAAGIEASHAEAIVSTVGRSVDGLLTESRFESAMAEQTAYLDKRLAEQSAYLENSLAEQRAYLEKSLGEQSAYLENSLAEQRAYLEKSLGEQRLCTEKRLAEQQASLEKHLGEQRVGMEKRLGEHTVAIAELKSEIYRYLWLHGSMIVLVLTSLYAMVEGWARG